MARTGRGPGGERTRGANLCAARQVFADRGYLGGSIRRIAASAGVGPALVHYYFATKNQLFLAAMTPPIDAGPALRLALSGETSGAGIRLVVLSQALHDMPIDPTGVDDRAGLIATELVGLATARYILQLEPLASAAPDELAAFLGPTIDRYLTEPTPRLRNGAPR